MVRRAGRAPRPAYAGLTPDRARAGAARRRGLRRHPRRRRRLGHAAPGSSSSRWRPAGATRHVVLVGKGITFDTGGISIKPRDAHEADAQGHGRRPPRSSRPTLGAADLRAAGTGDRAGAARREHGQRLGVPAGRRDPPLRRHAPARAPTPTPRAGWCWPTRSPTRSRALAPGRAGRPGHADRRQRGRARQADGRAVQRRRRRWPPTLADGRGARPASRCGGCRWPTTTWSTCAATSPTCTAAPTAGAGSVVAALYLREFTGDAARPVGAHRHVGAVLGRGGRGRAGRRAPPAGAYGPCCAGWRPARPARPP